MIIDAHAHIYPDKIAEKASAGISSFYGIPVAHNGMLTTLLREGEKAGVDRFLVQSVATVPEQVENINSFIYSAVQAYPDKLIGFGTIHPDYPDIEREVERVVSLGLKGLKLHGDMQGFDLDEEKAYPIYEAAEHFGLPILFHAGDPRSDRTTPDKLYRVTKRFPKLKVIGAHLCGWTMWDRAEELFENSGVYSDCSSSLYALEPSRAARIIRKIGTKRVFWGTDYPVWSAAEELERFAKLPLTEQEREDILGRNLLRLLGEEQ